MASRPNGPSGAQRWLFSLGGGNGYSFITLCDNGARRWDLGKNTAQDFHLYNQAPWNTALVILRNSSNVGIGTTWPEEELHVGGNIRADGTVQLTQGGFLSANTSGWWPTFGLNFATRNQGGGVFYTPPQPPLGWLSRHPLYPTLRRSS